MQFHKYFYEFITLLIHFFKILQKLQENLQIFLLMLNQQYVLHTDTIRIWVGCTYMAT